MYLKNDKKMKNIKLLSDSSIHETSSFESESIEEKNIIFSEPILLFDQ